MFLITSGSTRGHKDEQGRWHFDDDTVSFFGKRHHRHKYPVGHKTHSLRTISGVPLVTLLSPAYESDQAFILPLVEELLGRYPELQFSYLILDRGYDAEQIHQNVYEYAGIIPVIIRKKMVYPKSFTEDGYPLCPWGFAMKPRGIEYKQQRTKYACFRVCKKYQQPLLFEAVTRKRSRRCSRSTHSLLTRFSSASAPRACLRSARGSPSRIRRTSAMSTRCVHSGSGSRSHSLPCAFSNVLTRT